MKEREGQSEVWTKEGKLAGLSLRSHTDTESLYKPADLTYSHPSLHEARRSP